MSLENIAAIFRNTLKYVSINGLTPEFIWHGGEPFLIPLAYYKEIEVLQRQIFGEIEIKNTIQTNLSVLTDDILEYLCGGSFFSGIGVSFDVYGEERVDAQGRLHTNAVLNNMQRLLDAGISFGAIAVLTKQTAPYARHIYHFYDNLQVKSRLLTFYLAASDGQIARHMINKKTLVNSIIDVFQTWIGSATATPIEPINEYLGYAISFIKTQREIFYDRKSQESAFVVETNGDTWGINEVYSSEFKFGNLVLDDLQDILNSVGRKRAICEAESRTAKYCKSCRFFGACHGQFVQYASPQEQEMLRNDGCPVSSILERMISILSQYELMRTPNPAFERVAAEARHPSTLR
jgi:uncharacterized protein